MLCMLRVQMHSATTTNIEVFSVEIELFQSRALFLEDELKVEKLQDSSLIGENLGNLLIAQVNW